MTNTPEGPSILFMPRAQAYDSFDRNGIEAGIKTAVMLFEKANNSTGVTGSVLTSGKSHTDAEQFLNSLVNQAMTDSAMVQWKAGNRYITITFYPNYFMTVIGIKTK